MQQPFPARWFNCVINIILLCLMDTWHKPVNVSNAKAFKFLPASGDFCHLLITFANSLDPHQDRQNVGPDLDPNCSTL